MPEVRGHDIMSSRLSTGIPGLDEILRGGLIHRRIYLVRGGPGTGKSTLGMHFLTAGAALNEKVLYITLGETEAQISNNATSIGFDLAGVKFLDLTPGTDYFVEDKGYDIFSPAEIERGPTTQKIVERIESLLPSRVFIDSVTQLRYLATDAFQYRKQMYSLARYLTEKGATVLCCSEGSVEAPDDDLQFLCDAVINLELSTKGRIIKITKFRGSGFQNGVHSMRLGNHGMQVFPRLEAGSFQREFTPEELPFGIPELDKLLHGGLERGTATIISGPSGVGKTTLGLRFLYEAAKRGERSVIFSFEEGKETIIERCESIQMPLRNLLDKGTLAIVEVEPLFNSPDEFTNMVRNEISQQKTRNIMLDSTSGYQLSLYDQDLAGHLHTLGHFLNNAGVTTILISEVESITGEFRATEAGISYLVDNIIFLRHVETSGELKRTIGILKKRTSDFDKTLCEFEITRRGVKVGKPLTAVDGILGGVSLIRSIFGGR